MTGRRGRPKQGLSVVRRTWDRREGESAKSHALFMMYAEIEPMIRKIPTVISEYHKLMGTPEAKVSGHWIFTLAKDQDWDSRAADRDLHLQKVREQSKEKVVAEEARKEAVDVEAMRQDLAAKFGVVNEKTDTLIEELLSTPEKRKLVSVQGLTGLLRTQLDIARYLDGVNPEAGGSAEAEKEARKKSHAQKLFEGSGTP